jgi:YVTN family beta-propeller protein
MNSRKKVATALLAMMVLGTGTAFAVDLTHRTAGPQADGTAVTSYNWTLTPAGKQIQLGDFPMGSVISPDHKYIIVSNDGQGTQSLQVVNAKTQKVVQTISYEAPEALYLGVAFSPDGKTVYASAGGNNKIRVYSFNDGHLTEQSPIQMSDVNKTNFYPAGLTVSPDGKYLYVADNMSGQVSKIDLTTKQIVSSVSVGKFPYAVALSKDGTKLYVSNWGESSVSVINATFTKKSGISVGLHPNAIAINPKNGDIYVSDSDSDQISVIDSNSDKVVQTISLAPYKRAKTGSQPDALAVSPDGQTLYVANAGNNDVAVISLGEKPHVKGLIPTAWYPTSIQLSSDGKQIMVLNAKGMGAGPNKGYQEGTYGPSSQYIGSMMKGTLSFIDTPDDTKLKIYTQQVMRDDRFLDGQDNGEGASVIPRFTGEQSPIKHVIYVIKENRTYDQVFGDMKKGNGDPNLTEFGQNITPNLHKLANQFVLLDNFYADAEISAQGHNWATGAKANDYAEKNWLANYSNRNRPYDFEGDNSATYPQAGFLWDEAKRDGVSFRDYGEFYRFGQSVPADPSIGNNYDPNFTGWDLNTSDLTRFDEWNKEFQQFVKNGNLPQLEILRLPNDHTKGTAPGSLSPQSYVAQNDLAVGKLVDAVSHSPYWKNTAIFITEDDAQDGPDHVDAHRTEALVISPYTQKGTVDSTFYDTTSMLKTMELILGMKPLTQFDTAATPMLNTFTTHPNFKPYVAVGPTYPLDRLNGQNAPLAQESSKMDFSREDAAPDDQLNLAIWKATKGNVPYPKDLKQQGDN